MVGRSVREEDVAAANECNARFYPLFAPLSVREVGADTQLSDLSFAPPCTCELIHILEIKQQGIILPKFLLVLNALLMSGTCGSLVWRARVHRVHFFYLECERF